MIQSLLLTGPFGSGKSSVAAEIAEELERDGVRYAAIDLDWLCWGWPGSEDEDAEHQMMLTNLEPVVANYRAAGVTRFVLARSMRHRGEVESVRNTMTAPLHVVGLRVPWSEIERRLGADPSSGRAGDLAEAAARRDAGIGTGFEDLVVDNHERTLPEVASEILEAIGWR